VKRLNNDLDFFLNKNNFIEWLISRMNLAVRTSLLAIQGYEKLLRMKAFQISMSAFNVCNKCLLM
jgi:hypothetical protein